MSAETRGTSARQEFMKGEGFILYTDVTERVIDMLIDEPLPALHAYELQRDDLSSGSFAANNQIPESLTSFYTVCKLLRMQVPTRHNTESHYRTVLFGFTPEEIRKTEQHTFDKGIDDLDISWQFVPPASASVVRAFVKSGELSMEDVEKFSLEDWAAMIESDWFCGLMEDFGRTGWGVIGSFGVYATGLTPNALQKRLIKIASEVYNYPDAGLLEGFDLYKVHKDESKPGIQGLSATITPEWHAALRYMRQNNLHGVQGSTRELNMTPSDGCPVGREFAWIPEDYATTMPRAVRLRDIGRISISAKPNADGEVLVRQDASGIKRATQFLAGQVYSFAWYYGIKPPTPATHLVNNK